MRAMLQLLFIPMCLFGLTAYSYAQVDYEDQIQPIFDEYCVECHGGQNGVTLSSYSAVMGSVGATYETEIVEPGKPDESPLVDKIEPNPEIGERMPQGGPFLTDDEINLIRTWIAEGAHETPVSNELITELPKGFKLNGNYPNPFNPTTTISFEVSEAVSYQVKIYTAHGALVEEIAGNASAGQLSVEVNFNNQPSGVYFYQVIAISANQRYLLGSEKMTLVK